MYGTNELNLWSRIRGAAGRFVKSILVPTGKAALLTLLNPASGKAAQIAYNDTNEGGGNPSEARPAHFQGYTRLNLSSLAENVRARLSRALGGDVTQLRDLLVSTKSVASIFASSSARVVGGDLDDDC